MRVASSGEIGQETPCRTRPARVVPAPYRRPRLTSPGGVSDHPCNSLGRVSRLFRGLSPSLPPRSLMLDFFLPPAYSTYADQALVDNQFIHIDYLQPASRWRQVHNTTHPWWMSGSHRLGRGRSSRQYDHAPSGGNRGASSDRRQLLGRRQLLSSRRKSAITTRTRYRMLGSTRSGG